MPMRFVHTAEGNGPGQRHRPGAAGAPSVPAIRSSSRVHLTDYKVRILDGATATGAVTRVLIDATDGERSWTTIGVSANIIEASWQALADSIVYGLLHANDSVEGLTRTGRPTWPPVPRRPRSERRVASG